LGAWRYFLFDGMTFLSHIISYMGPASSSRVSNSCTRRDFAVPNCHLHLKIPSMNLHLRSPRSPGNGIIRCRPKISRSHRRPNGGHEPTRFEGAIPDPWTIRHLVTQAVQSEKATEARHIKRHQVTAALPTHHLAFSRRTHHFGPVRSARPPDW
jgi:hypothetical protein